MKLDERHTDELVRILHSNGAVTLANHAEGYRACLFWEKSDFTSSPLWISNRGRAFPPWNNHCLGLGVEPACSTFDLGTSVATSPNPLNRQGIPTLDEFPVGLPWTTWYRIEISGPEASIW